METKRIVFLDYLRAIACFMVILVHVCEAFYFNLDGISFSSNADRWWISFIDSFLRPCVPLFIMASAGLFQTPLHPCVHSLRRLGASLCLFTLVVGRSRLGQRENPLAHVPLQFPVQRHTSLVCVHVDRGLFLYADFVSLVEASGS
mgnify:CR=1 FL=1